MTSHATDHNNCLNAIGKIRLDVSHLGQAPSDRTRLLRPEVQWEVFLVLVILAEILT